MCTLLSALGAGASLFSGIAQSRNAKAQADAQASALEANARNARILGHDAIERGGQEELRLRRSLAQHRGTQRAARATAGIDIDSGSAFDAQIASMSEGEHDAEAIRFNAARERWGYEQQASNMENQAAYYRAAGKSAASNILFGTVMNIGLGLGNDIYQRTRGGSPLTEYEDRSKYWGPVYNPIERRRRGYM